MFFSLCAVAALLGSAAADVRTIRYATYNASSPLGPWAPSVVNDDWAADGNITEPVWCIQNNAISQEAVDGQVGQAEDCLLLRVFRPDNFTFTNSSDGLLPVMLWIHGGLYLMGSGASEDLYYGGFLANQENIIVISINYRLGVHGFLGYKGTYGDAINSGTIDQRNAIAWTHANIEELGGDPGKIALAGESAGATSVNIHIANEETNQMLERAILESNPAGINLKTASDQLDLFRTLARKKMGCDRATDDELMDCLVIQARTQGGMAEIVKMSPSVTYTNSLLHLDVWMTFYTWAPSVDDSYVFGQPNHVAVDTWPASKALLIGTNEDEARFFQVIICSILEGVADQVPMGDTFIKCDGGNLYDHALYRGMGRLAYGLDIWKIDNYYRFQSRNEDESLDDAIEQFTLLVTDSLFTCPTYDMARAMSPTNTYFYRYAVDAICSVASDPTDCEGFSCHGDEIATVFGSWGVSELSDVIGCSQEKVEELESYVDAIQAQWGHFVREGKPKWGAVRDETGPVYFFGQTGEGDNRTAATFESNFTTHHTEKGTAQEVCDLWEQHTYKTESGSKPSGFLAFAVLLTNVSVLLHLLY